MTTEQPTPVAPVLTDEELLAQLDEVMKSGDFKAVARIANEVAKRQKTKEQVELEERQKVLAEVTEKTKSIFSIVLSPIANAKPISDKAVADLVELVNSMAKTKALDLADGIWYSNDFGEKLTTCRLMKSAPRKSGGGGTGKKFDTSTNDLLAKFGTQEYKDGISYQQAFESNTDGNFRYQLRVKLLKLDGQV